MKWLKSLLSAEGDTSSKRVSAILALLVCINLTYIGTFTEYKTPEYMFDGLLILAGGLFGGTVIEKFIKKTNKQDDTTGEESN